MLAGFSKTEQCDILVVDDDNAVRSLVSAALRSHGLDATLAINGRDGVEHVCAAPERFKLIIMDCHMPEMDGLAACRLIRRCAPGAAIVLMSTEQPGVDLDEIGARDFLAKPFTATDLVNLVQRHLA